MADKKTILVTGGAGFIGSHLCESLLNDGYGVICLDNLITGSRKNIEQLKTNPGFEFIEADVSQKLKNDVLEKIEGVSYLFHLASPASPVDFQKIPEEIMLVNSLGTLNILEVARKNESKVLIASTSEVYGDPLEHPQKETYFGNVNTFGPRSCYDESKRFSETATYVYLKKYDLDTRIVRIFNTYGPNMKKDDGRVISNFVNFALENRNLKIDGNGSQTRSFCYVSDMVDGLQKALFSEKTKGEIINLGNPEEFTIKNLAEKVIELTSSTSVIEYTGNFRVDDPMRRQPDITKAKNILKWEPNVGLDEGLGNTIEYYSRL